MERSRPRAKAAHLRQVLRQRGGRQVFCLPRVDHPEIVPVLRVVAPRLVVGVVEEREQAGRGFSSGGSARAASARSTWARKASGIAPSTGSMARSRIRSDRLGHAVSSGKSGRPPIFVAPTGTVVDVAAENSREGTA